MRVGRLTVASMLAGLLMTTAGCSGRRPESSGGAEGQMRLYGADGNMSNLFGEAFKDKPGALAGMKGTTPLTPLSETFKRRMRGIDPNLADFSYGGESYDAVIIAALAAESARTTEPTVVARQINGVTAGPGSCETFARCVEFLRAGRDIAYRGVSMRYSGFTDPGEPSSASYGILHFGRENTIDDGKTEFVGAGDERAETKTTHPPAGSNGRFGKEFTPLKFGGLLPKTGDLAIAGPPLFAGARLAVKEINDAGGVGGDPVEWVDGDDGTSPQVAAATVDRFITAGVHVIVGASASGVTAAVLPKAIAAGRIMVSPSATSDELTTMDDKGLFFRTSPPDLLQAKALADIIMRDGARKVVVVARDDSYGKGLANNVRTDLRAGGITDPNIKVLSYPDKDEYDPNTEMRSTFGPISRQIKQFHPEAVLLVGFAESELVIRAMLADQIRLS